MGLGIGNDRLCFRLLKREEVNLVPDAPYNLWKCTGMIALLLVRQFACVAQLSAGAVAPALTGMNKRLAHGVHITHRRRRSGLIAALPRHQYTCIWYSWSN